MIQDIRFGLRLVIRSPWLSITAIVSLAIGIGATTAVFTVIKAALVKALPYPDVDRLVAVTQGDTRYFSLSEFRALDTDTAALDHLAAVETRDFVLSDAGRPEQTRGQRVTASFPALMGLDSSLRPVVGRGFASRQESSARAPCSRWGPSDRRQFRCAALTQCSHRYRSRSRWRCSWGRRSSSRVSGSCRGSNPATASWAAVTAAPGTNAPE